MNEGAYFPSAKEALITGKAFPDIQSLDKWHKTRKDGFAKMHTYPGSEDKSNYAIMPHELLIGYKEQKNNYTNDPAAQLGFTAVPGLSYNTADPEILMDNFYFIGVPTDEWYYNGENMYNTDSLDHGIGVQIAGKCTVINTSTSDINPGDYIAWRLPPHTNIGDPGDNSKDANRRNFVSVDNGFNPMVSRNRMGTPFGKPIVQLEKFDPLNFDFQLAAAFTILTNPQYKDKFDMTTFNDNPNQYSLVEQEAYSWGLGIRIIALISNAIIQNDDFEKNDANLINNAKILGLIKDDALIDTNKIEKIYQNIFRHNTVPGKNDKFMKTKNDNLNKLLDNGLYYLTSGVGKAMMLKLSRVIGKSASSAAPSKSLDIVLVGARIGI